MTKAELKNALPEMVMFAKTEEDKNHFKKLQALDSLEELDEEVKKHVAKNEIKYDYKASYKFSKNRRA
jgi:hypothetical protein